MARTGALGMSCLRMNSESYRGENMSYTGEWLTAFFKC